MRTGAGFSANVFIPAQCILLGRKSKTFRFNLDSRVSWFHYAYGFYGFHHWYIISLGHNPISNHIYIRTLTLLTHTVFFVWFQIKAMRLGLRHNTRLAILLNNETWSNRKHDTSNTIIRFQSEKTPATSNRRSESWMSFWSLRVMLSTKIKS